MKSRKGNASCHIPNDAYRTNYDRIFKKEEVLGVPEDWGVTCYECEWEGMISECPIEKDQESWEMPEYGVAVCPECGAGIEL
jgi:hypothetical protein